MTDAVKKEYKGYLSKVTQILFNQNSTWEELSTALQAMHSMLAEISDIKGAIKDKDERFETKLKSGLALSPGYAADCTLDTKRTVQYLRGLDAAVQKLKSDFPGQCINILYAGTGPFAPFALPLTERYKKEEISFTALDIHLRSLDSLKKIAAAFEIEGCFREYIQCDAVEYTHSGDYPIHIAVSETMHRTVSREPHAAITLNLAPQLTDGGIFIPEKVTVSASMSITQKEVDCLNGILGDSEIQDIRIDMGPVFELSKDTAYEYTEDKTALICSVVTVPELPEDYNELVLSTHIQMFDSICLKEKESGITQPFFARDIELPKTGDKIQFGFNLTGFPCVSCCKVNKEEDVFSKLENIAASL